MAVPFLGIIPAGIMGAAGAAGAAGIMAGGAGAPPAAGIMGAGAGLTSRDALRPSPKLCVPATTRYTVPAALAAPSAACYECEHHTWALTHAYLHNRSEFD